jgi:hypothetical protein
METVGSSHCDGRGVGNQSPIAIDTQEPVTQHGNPVFNAEGMSEAVSRASQIR